jgi:UDP-glucuronate decarboxylase
MSRVLVTGGAGFIGSNLVEALLAGGNDVVAIDNLFTGRLRNLPDTDISRFVIRNADVRSTALYGMRDLYEIEAIYHLACPASPPHYRRDPIFTLETAILGTRNVLELAHRARARVLMTSTSEVYGEPEIHPQPEGYWGKVNPVGRRSCYDEGKRAAEALAIAYVEKHDLDVRIARVFNTYGPRMAPDDGRVVSNFCVQALSGKPLTVYGEGSQTRSLCYISDLVDGLMRLMAVDRRAIRRRQDPDPAVLPVNLGNPEEVTVGQIAALIGQLLERQIVVEHRPLPSDDPTRRRPSITRAEHLLRWKPQVPLREGLRKTLDYFRGELALAEVAG